MIYERRLVRHFAPGTRWYWKIYANIVYQVGLTRYTRRPNLLNGADRERLAALLERGDVVLVGNLRKLSHFVLGPTVTHSILNLGGGQLIHAIPLGVQRLSLAEALDEYDTAAVLRLPPDLPGRERIIESAVRFAESRLGRPFDFVCREGDQAYFCSQLVNEAFRAAGYDTGLESVGAGPAWGRFLKPPDMVRGNFQPVFLSRHLRLRGRDLVPARANGR